MREGTVQCHRHRHHQVHHQRYMKHLAGEFWGCGGPTEDDQAVVTQEFPARRCDYRAMKPESHVVSLALAEIHAAEVVADTVSAEDRESFFPGWRANDEMKEAGVLLIHGRLHIRAKPSEARA